LPPLVSVCKLHQECAETILLFHYNFVQDRMPACMYSINHPLVLMRVLWLQAASRPIWQILTSPSLADLKSPKWQQAHFMCIPTTPSKYSDVWVSAFTYSQQTWKGLISTRHLDGRSALSSFYWYSPVPESTRVRYGCSFSSRRHQPVQNSTCLDVLQKDTIHIFSILFFLHWHLRIQRTAPLMVGLVQFCINICKLQETCASKMSPWRY